MSKTVPSDIEIAQAANVEPIEAIAEKMGLVRQDIELYGDHMAKIKLEAIEKFKDRPNAKYVVVTAITPTPLGEGKSTTTVGLAQGLHQARFWIHRHQVRAPRGLGRFASPCAAVPPLRA